MLRAYKYRIYPTKEQEEYLSKVFGCVRFVYNKMLSDKIEYYKQTGKTLKTTPAQYKKEYPFLKEVDSLALANAQLNLEKAYKNFFRNTSFLNIASCRSPQKSLLYGQPYISELFDAFCEI